MDQNPNGKCRESTAEAVPLWIRNRTNEVKAVDLGARFKGLVDAFCVDILKQTCSTDSLICAEINIQSNQASRKMESWSQGDPKPSLFECSFLQQNFLFLVSSLPDSLSLFSLSRNPHCPKFVQCSLLFRCSARRLWFSLGLFFIPFQKVPVTSPSLSRFRFSFTPSQPLQHPALFSRLYLSLFLCFLPSLHTQNPPLGCLFFCYLLKLPLPCGRPFFFLL